MQIDFHHATTYTVARYAGFGHRAAEIIAYCAQYVDDATNSGSITFDNGAMYSRISSAHKMLDYRNFKALNNHHVWIPYHFLPGNGGQPVGENPKGSFIEKIICRPDSFIARDLLRECILNGNKPYGLFRLGITMHVYADTWAHQGFAGVIHEVNNVQALDADGQIEKAFGDKMKDFFGATFDQITGKFVGDVLPLGHGAALSHPDKPFLQWSYIDCHGKLVKRNNTQDFLEAADSLCQAMQCYRLGNPEVKAPGLPSEGREKIEQLFLSITDDDGAARHKKWLKKIKEGYFDFPGVKLEYRAKGLDSWKHQALGTRKSRDKKTDIFPYHESFLESEWKMFHDALLAHRFHVIHELLPRYGICVA